LEQIADSAGFIILRVDPGGIHGHFHVGFPRGGVKKTRDETSRMKSGKLSFTRED